MPNSNFRCYLVCMSSVLSKFPLSVAFKMKFSRVCELLVHCIFLQHCRCCCDAVYTELGRYLCIAPLFPSLCVYSYMDSCEYYIFNLMCLESAYTQSAIYGREIFLVREQIAVCHSMHRKDETEVRTRKRGR